MAWRPDGEGTEIPPPGGEDATVWAWRLARNSDSASSRVQVWVSGTAMSASNVPVRVDEARRSRGETEVRRILDWNEPPTKIEFHSQSEAPTIEGGDPGPEIREIAEITDWFQERGILLVFTARGLGIGPSVGSWTHSANLIDPEADELVGRFEAVSRLEAARAARRAWEQRDEARDVKLEAVPATAQASMPIPTIDPEQRERLKRLGVHLVWSAPRQDDPDSGWMIEAYDDDDKLLDIAVQPTAEDALLTILESLLPEDAG